MTTGEKACQNVAPMLHPQNKKESGFHLTLSFSRAEKGDRTLDPQLGKLMLCH